VVAGADLRLAEGSASGSPNCFPLFTFDKQVLRASALRIHHTEKDFEMLSLREHAFNVNNTLTEALISAH
jgi:hypothetical protein